MSKSHCTLERGWSHSALYRQPGVPRGTHPSESHRTQWVWGRVQVGAAASLTPTLKVEAPSQSSGEHSRGTFPWKSVMRSWVGSPECTVLRKGGQEPNNGLLSKYCHCKMVSAPAPPNPWQVFRGTDRGVLSSQIPVFRLCHKSRAKAVGQSWSLLWPCWSQPPQHPWLLCKRWMFSMWLFLEFLKLPS